MKGLGRFHRLEVLRDTGPGYYLKGDKFEMDILLPGSEVEAKLEPGDQVDAFVYLDSEDRPVATLRQPKAQVGDFAVLKVVSVGSVGAFLNWGLAKDLLLPFGEQAYKVSRGDLVLVAVYVDLETSRIVASAKLRQFTRDTPGKLEAGEQVSILVSRETPLGFECLINDNYLGLIHRAQVHRALEVGYQTDKAYVSRIREDGKVDITLTAPAGKQRRSLEDQILELLKASDGIIPIGDRSSPKEIAGLLGCSKKEFKRAIGGLYKWGKVIPSPKETRLA